MLPRLFARILVLFSLLASAAFGAGTLVSGPMLGYQAHREVFLWVEVKDAQWVTLDYWVTGNPDTRRSIKVTDPVVTPAGGQVVHFRPGVLEMGAQYDYELSIDGVKVDLPYPATFKTRKLWEWRGGPPDFKFVLGSCAFINEPKYDRPGSPYGKTLETFRLAGETGSDFMIWLGDNWYYREVDFDSISGLWYRAQHDRAVPEMQRLLGTMHHYAIWDDHDFGPNDSNRAFEFKDEALKIFKSYWGNPSYGTTGDEAAYTKFYWGDAVFILLDNHWHRDAARINQDNYPEKTQWGARQLDWLKQSLIQAKELRHYGFKFIANGTQFLPSEQRGENHEFYRREREELLDFIREHEITGVVFLTGDVHHSGIYRRKLSDNGPWVYEITSSPLTSGSWDVANSSKANDPYVIKETLVGDQNFVTVEVIGAGPERRLKVSSVDKQGTTRFVHEIPAGDVGYAPRVHQH